MPTPHSSSPLRFTQWPFCNGHFAILRCLSLLTLCFLPSCASAPSHYDDPLAVLQDRSQGLHLRLAAAEQAQRELPADPKRIAALQKLVWERGNPTELAIYSIDELIRIDESAAKDYLGRAVVLAREWDVLRHIFNTAVARRWVDFIPAIVRNYALLTPAYTDLERPEYAAIAALRPDQPVEQTIFDVFAGKTPAEVRQRASAWSLLYRLTPDRDQLIARLRSLPPGDSLIDDLRASADDLSILPDTLYTLTWVRLLRTEPYAGFWAAATEAVAQLDSAKRQNLQLRHLPILIYLNDTDPDSFAFSHAELASSLRAGIDAQPHHLHGPNYDAPMQDHPQRFAEALEKLSYADLLTLRLITTILRDGRLTAELFKQADSDLRDTLTEHGGLIRPDTDLRPFPFAYPPLTRGNDLMYVPPEQLVIDGYTSLAHYHFHAQEISNGQFAGPGYGDLERVARTQAFHGLVFTFIDLNTLNADYYQQPDTVIDLGVIRR